MTDILFFIAGIALGFYIKSRIKGDNKTFTPKETDELESENKIKQIGESGKNVYYVPKA